MDTRTLIVDGDIELFQIGRVTEDITDFGDIQLESFDKEASIRLLDNKLESISKQTGYELNEIVFAISSETNFRKKHFPTYKSNRKNIRKPLGLKFMRQYVLDNMDKYQTVMLEDFEADDVMGMYGTAPKEEVGDIAIYSMDKDLFTIPVKQWCFKKNKFIKPSKLESLRFLYTQVLTGDTVDGYSGCPKIGKVKAKKALDGCNTEYELLKQCHILYYKEYGQDAKSKLLYQIGQARITHRMDADMLMKYDLTYDPYNMLEINDEMLRMWEDI